MEGAHRRRDEENGACHHEKVGAILTINSGGCMLPSPCSVVSTPSIAAAEGLDPLLGTG